MIISLLFIKCKKDSIDNPGYAIGIINYYKPRVFPNSAFVDYSFNVNLNQYGNQYGNRSGGKKWYIPPYGNYTQGDKYMVQYNKDNPSGIHCSRMLFNYKVNDSLDYEAYVKMFQTYPPQ